MQDATTRDAKDAMDAKDADTRRQPRIILALDAEIALSAQRSPPVGAGQDRFLKAAADLVGNDGFKALRVRSVTVATPVETTGVGNRTALHYAFSATDADGAPIEQRRFDIEHAATGYVLRIGSGPEAQEVATFNERDAAIAVGAAWQKGAVDLVGAKTPRKAA